MEQTLWEFAERAHRRQKRKFTGEDYINHPDRVACRVADLQDSTEAMIGAAMLHDAVEDGGATFDEIGERFGPEVRRLVVGLTNQKHGMEGLSRAERKAMDRMRLARECREVKIIKLIDRIDNLNDIGKAPADFQRLYREESALLAEAIGDADAELKAELLSLCNPNGKEGE